MTIPTTSIDAVSTSAMRDGANPMSDTPLAVVAGHVLEQGKAFQAAVEQFQQAMAEVAPLPGIGAVGLGEVGVAGLGGIGVAGVPPATVGSPLRGDLLPGWAPEIEEAPQRGATTGAGGTPATPIFGSDPTPGLAPEIGEAPQRDATTVAGGTPATPITGDVNVGQHRSRSGYAGRKA